MALILIKLALLWNAAFSNPTDWAMTKNPIGKLIQKITNSTVNLGFQIQSINVIGNKKAIEDL